MKRSIAMITIAVDYMQVLLLSDEIRVLYDNNSNYTQLLFS